MLDAFQTGTVMQANLQQCEKKDHTVYIMTASVSVSLYLFIQLLLSDTWLDTVTTSSRTLDCLSKHLLRAIDRNMRSIVFSGICGVGSVSEVWTTDHRTVKTCIK